ncbi:MAG: Holliday junction branch migration protein RuvA [Alphaproteobacteria bacterium]|nr:Holliday junction branch migration protein RuvA [Alphaproteobacteria bacterium]
MIGKLKGRVDSSGDELVVIDVGGVGYEVFCSARTRGQLAPGEAAELIIETHVREDHIHLYGFLQGAEREWFRLLTSVQRVGAKMALAILSAYAPAQLAQAILAKDTIAFSRISGIGPKLAERIVAELKDKAASNTWHMPSKQEKSSAAHHSAPAARHLDEAVSALMHLGYSRSEAYAAASQALRREGDQAPLDALIRLSLKEMAG